MNCLINEILILLKREKTQYSHKKIVIKIKKIQFSSLKKIMTKTIHKTQNHKKKILLKII